MLDCNKLISALARDPGDISFLSYASDPVKAELDYVIKRSVDTVFF
jgi:hypothetical protein